VTGLCRSGKSAYPDEQTAQVALVEIRAQNALRGSRRRTPCRVYECHWCAAWHLTSQPEQKKGTAA
jgi:hypothetical protein